VTRLKARDPAVRVADRGASDEVSLGGGNSSEYSPSSPEPQAALSLDDWQSRVIRDAEAFMKRKGKAQSFRHRGRSQGRGGGR